MGQRSIYRLVNTTVTCYLLAFSSANIAATPQEDTPAPWYEVELIIFNQANAPYQQDELWPNAMEPTSLEGVMELQPVVFGPIDNTNTIEGPLSPEQQAFRLLPQEVLQLSAEYERLLQSEKYEPLLHVGWRQPGLAKENAITVHIHDALGRSPTEELEATPERALIEERGIPESDKVTVPPENSREIVETDEEFESAVEPSHLDGTIKLILARYLHLEVDLGYRLPVETETIQEDEPDISAWLNIDLSRNDSLTDLLNTDDDEVTTAEAEIETNTPQYQVFRLQQKRRMRSKEIHYLDHPMFGIIALITPYEFPLVEKERAVPAIEWQRIN